MDNKEGAYRPWNKEVSPLARRAPRTPSPGPWPLNSVKEDCLAILSFAILTFVILMFCDFDILQFWLLRFWLLWFWCFVILTFWNFDFWDFGFCNSDFCVFVACAFWPCAIGIVTLPCYPRSTPLPPSFLVGGTPSPSCVDLWWVIALAFWG